jgi:signal peptidase II
MDDDTESRPPSDPRRPGTETPTLTTRLVRGVATLLVFVAGIAADQLTKWWALSALADGSTIPILPTVSLRLAFNPGVAFGLGADLGPVVAVGILVILLALSAWILWNALRGSARPRVLVLTAVAAGGWGNMYDRISRAEGGPLSGSVVDFIAVDWFAVFNVADILTVVGMMVWAGTALLTRPRPLR